MAEPKLNEDERACLSALCMPSSFDLGECAWSFKPISAETGLDRKRVRRACRSLKRKGLANFSRGLFNDDGKVAGSGYAISRAGIELTTSQNAMREGGEDA